MHSPTIKMESVILQSFLSGKYILKLIFLITKQDNLIHQVHPVCQHMLQLILFISLLLKTHIAVANLHRKLKYSQSLLFPTTDIIENIQKCDI
jgi:hypothetical protein